MSGRDASGGQASCGRLPRQGAPRRPLLAESASGASPRGNPEGLGAAAAVFSPGSTELAIASLGKPAADGETLETSDAGAGPRHPLHLASLLAWPLRMLVFVYQRLISPALPAACRYYPSCSEYAAGALATHGAIKGSLLAVHRLLRCHPWCEGGFDPVPQRARSRGGEKLAQHPRHG